MVALKTERRVFLWKITPRPIPKDSKRPVDLNEILAILEAEFKAGRARVYLGEASRILEDTDTKRDEKSQIYLACLKRKKGSGTVTLLINRGDPEAVAQSFIDSKTKRVRIPQPNDTESPGWSAHLVISLKSTKEGYHRACFEKMSRVSSSLVLAALDKIIARAAGKDSKYAYVIKKKDGKNTKDETRRYRPTLDTTRVPSEKLAHDLEQGELSSIILTKKIAVYNGVGAEKLIKRQEEKIILRTAA